MGDLADAGIAQAETAEVFPNNVVIAWFAQALKTCSMIHSMEPPYLHRDLEWKMFRLNHDGSLKLFGFQKSPSYIICNEAPELEENCDKYSKYPEV